MHKLIHPPSQDEFLSWLEHPVTQALFLLCQSKIDEAKNLWVAGTFLDQSQFATAIENARAIGRCETLQALLDTEYEDIKGDFNGS